MKDLPFQGFSEIEVNDFGPIARAKVDLRPLTVFVGPGNAGKSYLATLIYALHGFFAAAPRNLVSGAVPAAARKLDLTGQARDDLSRWTERIFAGGTGSLSEESVAVPSEVADLVRSAFAGLGELGDVLGGELDRCFGTGGGTGKLVRERSRGTARVVFRRFPPDDSAPLSHVLTIASRGIVDFRADIPEGLPARLDSKSVARLRVSSPLSGTGPSGGEVWKMIVDLASGHMPRVFGPLHLPAFYLPADRAGVMSTRKAFVQGLIASAGEGRHPGPLISGVVADFLQRLLEIEPDGGPGRRRASRSDLAGRIENRVLGGSVRVARSAVGLPVFTYRPEGWKTDIPLANASSMVSELAPVALYLRHVVFPGSVLIVEEPESCLHPAMQVEFARQIAAAVNSGVRMIITTHSEWLLEELANLVRLSELSRSARRKIDKDDVALRPDRVGVWLFERKIRPKGSVVREIPLDEESGLFPTGFDDVAVALHNKWADISGGIEGKR